MKSIMFLNVTLFMVSTMYSMHDDSPLNQKAKETVYKIVEKDRVQQNSEKLDNTLKAKPEHALKQEYPLLIKAIQEKADLATIEELLKKGIYVNEQDNNGQTSFHWAVLTAPDNFQLIQLLIRYGAVNWITDNDGHTPLELLKDKKLVQQAAELIRDYAKLEFSLSPLF